MHYFCAGRSVSQNLLSVATVLRTVLQLFVSFFYQISGTSVVIFGNGVRRCLDLYVCYIYQFNDLILAAIYTHVPHNACSECDTLECILSLRTSTVNTEERHSLTSEIALNILPTQDISNPGVVQKCSLIGARRNLNGFRIQVVDSVPELGKLFCRAECS